MPSNFKRSTAAVNAEADAVCLLAAGGFLDLYTGPQPATADAAVTTQTRLARLGLAEPAFSPALGGKATAKAIRDEVNAKATGTAIWFRVVAKNGYAPVFDGSVAQTDSDCTLTDPHIQQGGRVSVTWLAYTATRE